MEMNKQFSASGTVQIKCILINPNVFDAHGYLRSSTSKTKKKAIDLNILQGLG